MNNPDFIIIILLCILIFSLFHSNKELFDLQAQYKNLYPIFSPSSDVNSAKSNLNNSQLQIFNNILKKSKIKLIKVKQKIHIKLIILMLQKKLENFLKLLKSLKLLQNILIKLIKGILLNLLKSPLVMQNYIIIMYH